MSASDDRERPPRDPELLRERTRGQVRLIVEALGGDDVVGVAAGDSDDPADFAYLYRRDHLLVRDADVPRVQRVLGAEGIGAEEAADSVNGLTLLILSGGAAAEGPGALALVDRDLGIGVATPDHVLYVTPNGGGSCCPATEPEEPGTQVPWPPRSRRVRGDGAGVLVSVVDTGWHPPAAVHPLTPWLAGVTGDEEVIDPDHIHPYAGHGTFIAGVVRCVAPRTEVRVEGFLPTGGAVFESEITKQLCQALALGPDVISLSAGCRTREDRPLLSFEVFWTNFLSRVKGTVLVAAAGNDSTRAPFWPAAFPWAVSVGAVDDAGARADFSNFGSWVDVYAIGVGLVNAYPTGTFECQEPPDAGDQRHFDGLARWSGTSFSTPYVAGLIAARMSATGLGARHATDQLLAEARAQAVPGVGPCLRG